MKKIIFILAILLVTTTSFAKSAWYKLNDVAIMWADEDQYGNWIHLKPAIDMVYTPEEGRMIIYSHKTQVLDILFLKEFQADGFNYMEYTGTDSNFKRIDITVMMDLKTKEEYLLISYPNVSYMYTVGK